ncbi:hypothetical protein TGPRC2_426620 [Toxoplasma gondii TgCatPRC2]|uniref:Uncharacterized protein n=1 Tax=Toxoplasma gondii TgCatPRC2 TaxID=1130821 RepID=A0A151H2Y7_TOXGO|nr:hypothetical protein TGPRC2_426620 [Toxoplasma gondii TgCatPRC2]
MVGNTQIGAGQAFSGPGAQQQAWAGAAPGSGYQQAAYGDCPQPAEN